MLTLTEFLLARIAEDERMWKLAETAELAFTTRSEGIAAVPPENFARRMVAECEATRRIVEDYEHLSEASRGPLTRGALRAHAEFVVQVLALPFADHPDYREEWKP